MQVGPEICHVDRCPHGCTSETGCRGTVSLLNAARAVVERWDTPLWKDAPHTGNYIHSLRQSVALIDGRLAAPPSPPPAGPAAVPPQAPKFPTMLRKMWSGREVQAWIDQHWPAAATRKASE